VEPVVQWIVVVVLAVLLCGVAGYVVHGQRQTQALLARTPELSAEDRRYLHRQVVRRLFSAVLLIALAAFLVGWQFLEPSLEAIAPADAELRRELTESEKNHIRMLAVYVAGGLLVFLGVMMLAIYDLFATARYGARHRRQLEDDRREALLAEVERLRRDRTGLNGHGPR
jgi:hypothetical protein